MEPVALQKLFIKKVSNVEYPEKRDTSEFAKELAFNIMKAKVELNFFSHLCFLEITSHYLIENCHHCFLGP